MDHQLVETVSLCFQQPSITFNRDSSLILKAESSRLFLKLLSPKKNNDSLFRHTGTAHTKLITIWLEATEKMNNLIDFYVKSQDTNIAAE